jgi:hypothetical protein
MYTVAFTIKTPHEGKDVTEKELLRGIRQRLSELRTTGKAIEACGIPDDTYEYEGIVYVEPVQLDFFNQENTNV